MMEKELLEKLGLTGSEAKVYLALLKIGEFSTKGPILKETKIAPSKVYYVLDKLISKGLVTTIIKQNIKHFAAAPPYRLKDYLVAKKRELAEEEKTAAELMPRLEGLYKTFGEKTTAEIFVGWQGMESAYYYIMSKMKRGDNWYGLGASEGEDPEKTKQFFNKYGYKVHQKKIKARVIFNENARDYVAQFEKETGVKLDRKFLFKTSPVEVAVANELTAIVMLKKEPLVILIHDKQTAESFITYFEELWKIAKP